MKEVFSAMEKKLLKAGEVAKKAGILVTTIRYYTKIGLLRPAGYSPGKYNLYDEEEALKVLKLVDRLKNKRLTLDEIKNELALVYAEGANA